MPNQFDPWNFLPVVEFVQVFKEEGRVLASKIDDAKATFPFWFATFFPGHQGLHFSIAVRASPKAVSPCSVNVFYN